MCIEFRSNGTHWITQLFVIPEGNLFLSLSMPAASFSKRTKCRKMSQI